MPVRRMDQHSADDEKRQNGADLESHHHVIRLRRFANAAHQKHSKNKNNQKSGKIEVGRPSTCPKPTQGQDHLSQARCRPNQPIAPWCTAEANGNRHVADHVFENQVPADDPGKDFAQRRVRIGIGATGNRNHRRQFRITEAGKAAGNRHQQKRNRKDGPAGRSTCIRSGRCCRFEKIEQSVERLSMQRMVLQIFAQPHRVPVRTKIPEPIMRRCPAPSATMGREFS